MLDAIAFIADAPTQLAAEGARSRIQVAELGSYSDPRYGDFQITAAEVANWEKLLGSHFQGRVPIDQDHSTDRGGKSEAAGWITGLTRDGNAVYADVEWTPLGESAVKEKRYLYVSPTFKSDLKDQRGNSLGPALLRAALTNAPFLQQMPAVSLSAHAGFAERLADPTPPPADTRPAMSDLLKTLAATFGLPDDADEAKILDAAKTAKTAADAKPLESTDTKTLEAQAAAEGKVLLDAAQVTKLTDAADQGVRALSQLSTMKFDAAYDKALQSGRLDAKPETRELHAALYAADAEKSLKLLETLPEGVVNLTARGAGGHDDEIPAGYDEDSVKLDRRVKARMTEKGEDYTTSLSAVMAEDDMKAGQI